MTNNVAVEVHVYYTGCLAKIRTFYIRSQRKPVVPLCEILCIRTPMLDRAQKYTTYRYLRVYLSV